MGGDGVIICRIAAWRLRRPRRDAGGFLPVSPGRGGDPVAITCRIVARRLTLRTGRVGGRRVVSRRSTVLPPRRLRTESLAADLDGRERVRPARENHTRHRHWQDCYNEITLTPALPTQNDSGTTCASPSSASLSRALQTRLAWLLETLPSGTAACELIGRIRNSGCSRAHRQAQVFRFCDFLEKSHELCGFPYLNTVESRQLTN